MHISEVSSGAQPNHTPFTKKQIDIQYPADGTSDFPVAMQASAKHGLIYMITKYGYVYIFDISTGISIYTMRVSGETIFVTVEHHVTNGVLGINRLGQVWLLSFF